MMGDVIATLKELRDSVDGIGRDGGHLDRGDKEAWADHNGFFKGIDFALSRIDAAISEHLKEPKP